MLLQGLEREGLRLDGRDAGDALHRPEKRFLGRETGGLPRAEVGLAELDDDLEVQAAAAHHALHAHEAGHRLDRREHLGQGGLRGGERGLIVVARPLHAPLAGDVLEGHVLGNCRLRGGRGGSKRARETGWHSARAAESQGGVHHGMGGQVFVGRR